MNYTKGEWQIQEVEVCEAGGVIRHYYITGFIGSKTDRTIADVGCWTDRDNALEDAHLIAAAPEMYEALKVVFSHQEIENGRVVSRGMPTSEEILAIELALAKAEGK